MLATVKVEAQKVLDDLQRKKQRTNSTESKSAINSELSKLSARTALLTRRGITLFEEFADCKIDKDSYIEAVVANDEELHKIQIRIDELKNQLNAMKNKSTADGKESESILRCVINTDMVTGEVLSLIDRIIIYNDERIEIRFAFDDSNLKK